MPRRRRASERKILPDPKFKSEVVAKFINGMLCSEGKEKHIRASCFMMRWI